MISMTRSLVAVVAGLGLAVVVAATAGLAVDAAVAVVDGTVVVEAAETSGSDEACVSFGVVAAGVDVVSGSEVAAVVGLGVVLESDG